MHMQHGLLEDLQKWYWNYSHSSFGKTRKNLSWFVTKQLKSYKQ